MHLVHLASLWLFAEFLSASFRVSAVVPGSARAGYATTKGELKPALEAAVDAGLLVRQGGAVL